MASQSNKLATGLGIGKVQWLPPFQLVDENNTVQFAVSSSGVVTMNGSLTPGNPFQISGAATAELDLLDTTASAKQLAITVGSNLAQFRELTGAANSLLVLDLANNRVGVAGAPGSYALDVTGAFHASGDTTLDGNLTLSTAAKKIDLSNAGAGNAALKVVATTDTPSVTWTSSSGTHINSTAPFGYLKIVVGSTPYYMPFWA